jgi:hypothetical protein
MKTEVDQMEEEDEESDNDNEESSAESNTKQNKSETEKKNKPTISEEERAERAHTLLEIMKQKFINGDDAEFFDYRFPFSSSSRSYLSYLF